jgi:hypothetical protein
LKELSGERLSDSVDFHGIPLGTLCIFLDGFLNMRNEVANIL